MKKSKSRKSRENKLMLSKFQANKTHLSRKEYFILYWTVLFYEDTKDNYYLAEEFIARFFGFLFESEGNVDDVLLSNLPAPQKEFIEKYLSNRDRINSDLEFRIKCIADREKYSGKDLNKYFTLDEAELNEADTEFRAMKERYIERHEQMLELIESIGLENGKRFKFTAKFVKSYDDYEQITSQKIVLKKYFEVNDIKFDGKEILKYYIFGRGKGFDAIIEDIKCGDTIIFDAQFIIDENDNYRLMRANKISVLKNIESQVA